MTKGDKGFFALLLLLAVFIWVRDLSWLSTSDDTLPILVTLPLFWYLGAPWRLRTEPIPIDPRSYVPAGSLFLLGLLLNLTILLAASWTLLLWVWLRHRLEPSGLAAVKKLLVLTVMAFPWIALDCQTIGWYFRLSGAASAEGFFSLLGQEVTRRGTLLTINDMPVSVEPACSGLHTLQSLLIAGSVVAYLQLGQSHRFWWNIPLLAVIAWIANTIRIITICSAGLVYGSEFAKGPFHEFSGWAVLMVMFALCWGVFTLQMPKSAPPEPV